VEHTIKLEGMAKQTSLPMAQRSCSRHRAGETVKIVFRPGDKWQWSF